MKISTIKNPIAHERKPEFDDARFAALDAAFAELAPMDEVAEALAPTLKMMNPDVREIVADKKATPTPEASHTFKLTPGWNLIGIPFELDAESLAKFASVAAVFTYDEATQSYIQHEDTTAIVAGNAYWVFVAEATDITVTGSEVADYGVALARLGCTEQANVMFNNEKFLFPNSTLYVDMLKQTLTPSQSADNHIDTSMIDLHTLDTIHVTLTPEEEALQRQLEEDPAYKQKMKEQAKAERERQAELKRKAKAEQEKARKAQREAEKQALKAERARQDSIARAERELKKQQKNTES